MTLRWCEFIQHMYAVLVIQLPSDVLTKSTHSYCAGARHPAALLLGRGTPAAQEPTLSTQLPTVSTQLPAAPSPLSFGATSKQERSRKFGVCGLWVRISPGGGAVDFFVAGVPDLIASSFYDRYSAGSSTFPICTRCCLTMTNFIQVLSKSHSARVLIINTRPGEILRFRGESLSQTPNDSSLSAHVSQSRHM